MTWWKKGHINSLHYPIKSTLGSNLEREGEREEGGREKGERIKREKKKTEVGKFVTRSKTDIQEGSIALWKKKKNIFWDVKKEKFKAESKKNYEN